MNAGKSLTIRPVPFVAFWTAVALVGLILFAFAGAAYVFFLAAALHFIAAFVLSVDGIRERVAAAFWNSNDLPGVSQRPRSAALLFLGMVGVAWFGLGCLLIFGENITLLSRP